MDAAVDIGSCGNLGGSLFNKVNCICAPHRNLGSYPPLWAIKAPAVPREHGNSGKPPGRGVRGREKNK